MKIIISNNHLETSKKACDLFIKLLGKGYYNIGLATGSTQIRLYHELVKAYKSSKIDFSLVNTFNLDEYYKINPDYSLSYRYFMDNHFFKHINLPKKNINFLNGLANDPIIECKKYETKIKSLGYLDLQILGIGVNGHIGFCEPYSSFDSETSLVNLSDETIKQNSDGRFFKNKEEVPKQALTMGMKTIINAKKILVLANGQRKASAVNKAIEGPISSKVPASILLNHKNVVWMLDKEASSELK